MSELCDSDEGLNKPVFLKVKVGDSVRIRENEIAKVLNFVGGSRDPDAPTLFQAANIDTGEIHWVHAEDVKAIDSARNS